MVKNVCCHSKNIGGIKTLDYFRYLQFLTDLRVKAEKFENNRAVDCCLWLKLKNKGGK